MSSVLSRVRCSIVKEADRLHRCILTSLLICEEDPAQCRCLHRNKKDFLILRVIVELYWCSKTGQF